MKDRLQQLLLLMYQEQMTLDMAQGIMSKFANMPEILHFPVDYGKSQKQRIEDGHFSYIFDIDPDDPHLEEGKRKGIVWYEGYLLADSDKGLSTEEAIRRGSLLDKEDPFLPSKNEHLLSLAEVFPDEQRYGPIIAPGSKEKGSSGPSPLSLNRYWEDRTLGVSPDVGQVWHPCCRFLFVREIGII